MASRLSDVSAELARDGERYREIFRALSMSVGVYRLAAGAADRQGPHAEDEVYHVVQGRATFRSGEALRAVGPGDVLFVRAGQIHRFERIEADLVALVVFAPAETGPGAAGGGDREPPIHPPAERSGRAGPESPY